MPQQKKAGNELLFVIGALTSLLVASFLPIWENWFVSSWEEVGNKGSLYLALSYLPSQTREFGLFAALSRYHVANSFLLCAILVTGGLFTIFVGRSMNPQP